MALAYEVLELQDMGGMIPRSLGQALVGKSLMELIVTVLEL